MPSTARVLALVACLLAIGCARNAPGGFMGEREGGAGGGFKGCAVASSRGDIMHIFLTDATGPLESIEFGMGISDVRPQRIRLLYDAFGRGAWKEPGSGYGTVFIRPNVLYFLREGVVVIEEVTRSRVTGTFSGSAPHATFPADTTAFPLRPAPSEPMRVSGRFSAVRDARFSDWVYRRPDRANELPPPVHGHCPE